MYSAKKIGKEPLHVKNNLHTKNDSIFVFFGKVRLMIGEAADCRPGRVCRGMRRVLLNGIATEMSLPPFKAHTLFLHQTGAIKIKRARQKKMIIV